MGYWRLTLRLVLIVSVIFINVSRQQDGEVVTEAEPPDESENPPPAQTEGPEENAGMSTMPDTAATMEGKPTDQLTTTTASPEDNSKPKLKILFTYESPPARKVIDKGLEQVKTRLSNMERGYALGSVESVMVHGNDAIKIITDLCHRVDQRRPDLVIDFTKFGVPSEAVKVITKTLQIPTVSTSIGGPDALREWRSLLPSEANYLIQINPPEDFAIRVIRSLALQMNLTNVAIFHSPDFEMFHHQKVLLQDVPTKQKFMLIGKNEKEIINQLASAIASYFTTFFIAAPLYDIDRVLRAASKLNEKSDLFDEYHSWYSLSLEPGSPKCQGCASESKINLVHIQPALARSEETQHTNSKDPRDAFQINLVVDAIEAAGYLIANGSWPLDKVRIPCVDYKYKKYPEFQLDLRGAIESIHTREEGSSDPFYEMRGNGHSHTPLILRLQKIEFEDSSTARADDAGYWRHSAAGYEMVLNGTSLQKHVPKTLYRVVTVVQPPFVYKSNKCKGHGPHEPSCFSGYCIDLLDQLAKNLNFEYVIFNVSTYGYMEPNLPHDWKGMVRVLQDQEADIAVGAFSVYPEREQAMDFTAYIYEMVGYQVLMSKDKLTTSLFKFLTVLENDVWMCILGAFIFTSVLLWVFDRWSPYSYQNNKEEYEDDDEKREFTLRESLWFCMTSLTPQGGGEAPKNLSGRLVAATWWLFGFIIIASYTANLAAFLTVSRLEKPIETLEDLIRQYKVQYAPIENSSAWFYFDRMANVEHLFYEVWKDMSLDDNLTEFERSAFAVWEYPVSDKFTKIWQSFIENQPPHSVEEALERVKGKEKRNEDGTIVEGSMEQFAWIAEATEIRYQHMANCMLRIVGEEFSLNPYAFGVQKGSPLKQELSKEIRKLEHLRVFEKLKIKWWDNSKDKPRCSRYDDVAEGISLPNIGGVFSVIVLGFTATIIVTIIEFWWYHRANHAHDLSETVSEVGMDTRGTSAAFQPIQRADFSTKYSNDT